MTTDVGWEFTVLGPVTASCAGRPVGLGPRGRRATLAALLLDVGRAVPPDVLVDRVWGTDVPSRPLASIHAHVSRLRGGLRAAGGQADPPLHTEPPGYRLAVDPSAVDAVRFETSVRRAGELRERGEPAAARDTVRAGLALWRGEAYADVRAGFGEVEAGRLSGLRAAARLLAAELDLELGRHRVVVSELEELAAADPLHEPVQAALLLALYRCGRPAEALRRYAAVRAVIGRELGVEPGRELAGLHERMLRGDVTLEAPGGPDAPPAVVPVARPPSGPGSASGPRMVGRDGELARVCAAVTTAWDAAEPVVVAVTGEAGIGKTRLLDAAVARLTGADTAVVVARGRCWEHGGAPALWPWIQVVRAVAAAAGPAAAAVLTCRAAALHAVVPGLPGARPDVGVPEPGPVPLFDALTAFLEAVASGHRVLVVLEDMHWADRAGREMLEYLAQHAAAGRLAVLASVRSPGEDGPAGTELLGGLSRTGRAGRVTLSGLTTDDVCAYVTEATGHAPDPGAVQALAERTEGNPFFLGELVRLLDGPVTRIPDEVPDGVREVILRRLGRLPADDRRVLRTASVLGRTFDLDLLDAVCGLGTDVVDDAVDRATAAGFLCAEPDRPDEHRFTHALVARSIADDIGPGHRRRLHARAADVLRARAGDDPLRHADQVLHHLARAGGEDRLDAAVVLAVAAADAYLDRGNYVGAEAVLRDAEALVARLTGRTAERRELSVLTRLSSLHDDYRGPAFCDDRPSRHRALALARRLSADRDLTAALVASRTAALGVADFATADALFDELARCAETSGDPALHAIVRQHHGLTAYQQGRFATAVTELSAALDACVLIDPRPWSAVLPFPLEASVGHRAAALLALGRDDEAAADVAASSRLARSDDPKVAAYVLGGIAGAMVLADRPAEAADWGDRCVERCLTTELNAVVTYNRVMAGWGRERRAPGTGLAGMRAALAILDEPPALLMRPMLHGLLADVRLRAGGADADREALAVLDRALDEAGVTGNHLFGPQLHRLRARARYRLGDHAGAAGDRERCDRMADEQGVADRVRARWEWGRT